MALEDVSVALCYVGLVAVVVLLLISIVGLVDPTSITHCQHCSRWMLDQSHRPDGLCFRCRHHLGREHAQQHPHDHGRYRRLHVPVARP